MSKLDKFDWQILAAVQREGCVGKSCQRVADALRCPDWRFRLSEALDVGMMAVN